MIIEVTKADIIGSVRQDRFKCPLARAIKRTLGVSSVDVPNPVIHDVPILVNGKPKLDHTRASLWFVQQVDSGHEMQPITVELREIE